MYEIEEGSSTITPRTWEIDFANTSTFGQLYEKLAPEGYVDRPVGVHIGHKLPHREPTPFVKVKLSQHVFLLDKQGANFIRFQLNPPCTSSDQDVLPRKNVFNLLMENSKQLLLPPQKYCK